MSKSCPPTRMLLLSIMSFFLNICYDDVIDVCEETPTALFIWNSGVMFSFYRSLPLTSDQLDH